LSSRTGCALAETADVVTVLDAGQVVETGSPVDRRPRRPAGRLLASRDDAAEDDATEADAR
jgi:ABC-type glutathione transport system ATPase component